MSIRTYLVLPALIAWAIALAGCSSIPKSETPVSQFEQLDCPQLSAETAKAEETTRVATAARGDAWKVVIPFAVAARYVNAASALSDAQLRRGKLDEEQQRKGCMQAVR
jgi:hypothetical protein